MVGANLDKTVASCVPRDVCGLLFSRALLFRLCIQAGNIHDTEL